MITLMNILVSLLLQQDVAMADKLREDGKIWVVIGVILILFVGIILYLISLDRKISKIEKDK